jgi:tRNA A37 threonylcarbamoyladenosine synthetase subunit TsaC/SUA5/YrdC
MKTTYFHNSTLNKHGVDVTTDKGDTFGIACPDEQTARQIAAGLEAIELLATVAEPTDEIKQLLTNYIK